MLIVEDAVRSGCRNTFEIQHYCAEHINVHEEWCDVVMFQTHWNTTKINTYLDLYHIPCERRSYDITSPYYYSREDVLKTYPFLFPIMKGN